MLSLCLKLFWTKLHGTRLENQPTDNSWLGVWYAAVLRTRKTSSTGPCEGRVGDSKQTQNNLTENWEDVQLK